MEILNHHGAAIHAIFGPVGGGGLIAGVSAYVKYLKPEIRVVGVEAEGSACLAAAMAAKRRVKLPSETLDLFADGVSVAQVGEEPFKVARHCVDEVIVATTDEICAAVKDIFDDTRSRDPGARPRRLKRVGARIRARSRHRLRRERLGRLWRISRLGGAAIRRRFEAPATRRLPPLGGVTGSTAGCGSSSTRQWAAGRRRQPPSAGRCESLCRPEFNGSRNASVAW
jgi:hypothetical protein